MTMKLDENTKSPVSLDDVLGIQCSIFFFAEKKMKFRALLSRSAYLVVEFDIDDERHAREQAYMLAGEQTADAWSEDLDAIHIEDLERLDREPQKEP